MNEYSQNQRLAHIKKKLSLELQVFIYFILTGVNRKATKGISYFGVTMHVDGFETEHFWSGGITINHTGDFCSCCVLLAAELNNSIFLQDGKFSQRLTVSTGKDRFGRTAFGCNLLLSPTTLYG